MIVVEWLDRGIRHQETATTEPAARVKVAGLQAAGVTCVTYYEIEDVA